MLFGELLAMKYTRKALEAVWFYYEIFMIDHQKYSGRSFQTIINFNGNSEAVSALQISRIHIMDNIAYQ